MGCEPSGLVEEARAAKRSERGQSTGITEYWCVFDVEAPTRHPRLNEAVQMARDNGINVAISNPFDEDAGAASILVPRRMASANLGLSDRTAIRS